jgi:hypothetical protein
MANLALNFDAPVTTAEHASKTRHEAPSAFPGQSDTEAWRRQFRIERDTTALTRYERELPRLRKRAAALHKQVDTVKAERARLQAAIPKPDTVDFRERLSHKHKLEKYEVNEYYPTLKEWCEVDSDIRGMEADYHRRVTWLAADGITWDSIEIVQAPAKEDQYVQAA